MCLTPWCARHLWPKMGYLEADLITVYDGYIRPLAEFAAPVWYPGLNDKQPVSLESTTVLPFVPNQLFSRRTADHVLTCAIFWTRAKYGTPKRHLIIGDGLLQAVIKFSIGDGLTRSVIVFRDRWSTLAIGDAYSRSVMVLRHRWSTLAIGDAYSRSVMVFRDRWSTLAIGDVYSRSVMVLRDRWSTLAIGDAFSRSVMVFRDRWSTLGIGDSLPNSHHSPLWSSTDLSDILEEYNFKTILYA